LALNTCLTGHDFQIYGILIVIEKFSKQINLSGFFQDSIALTSESFSLKLENINVQEKF